MRAPGLAALTRVGFAARGVMYGTIGWMALRLGRDRDGAGALAFIAGGAGKVALCVMAAGFLGYALWRLTEAALGGEADEGGAKGAALRLAGAASGLLHLGLFLLALKLAFGPGGGGGDGARKGTAAAMALPGGTLLVALGAVALVAAGLFQLVRAWKGSFLRHLDPGASRRWVSALGRAGYAARGIVFLLVGWLLARAALAGDSGEAGGMGTALGRLPDGLHGAVAAGLFLFGLYSLVEARYRRIREPHPLAAARRAAGV